MVVFPPVSSPVGSLKDSTLKKENWKQKQKQIEQNKKKIINNNTISNSPPHLKTPAHPTQMNAKDMGESKNHTQQQKNEKDALKYTNKLSSSTKKMTISSKRTYITPQTTYASLIHYPIQK